MNLKTVILVLVYSIVSGCSVADFIAMEAPPEKAMKKTDLGNNPEYISLLNRSFQLKPLSNIPWQLKKKGDGIYHIEMFTKYSKQESICDLSEASVIITEIFSDDVNGGVFYSATVSCDDNTFYAPLNSWWNVLKESMEFRLVEN